ncbi:MAG: SMC-Scp complex subunit ScpB [Thermoplasmata archaeon]|nr:MAG: SMC-Scp complex subunit ScpB [Thermoplasmata archaeon]
MLPVMGDEEKVVEAVLFTAAKPMSVAEIAEVTGIDEKVVRKAIKALIEEYNGRESAIEIARVGRKYVMQVRKEYASVVATLAPIRIPRHLIKTLALIAYYQPITQSTIRDMIGPKVYSHVQHLVELGLVKCRKRGKTYVLTTTKKFTEYFDIDAKSREELRKKIEEYSAKLSG